MIRDIDSLLEILETAPSGPVELDQSLLYDEPLLSDQDEREDGPRKETISAFDGNFVCRKETGLMDSLEEALWRKRRNSNRMPLVSGQVCSPEWGTGRRDTIGTRIAEKEEVEISGKCEERPSNTGIQETRGVCVFPETVGRVQEDGCLNGHVERRERRLDELRKELNEREMKECTFKPNANKIRPASVLLARDRMPVEERLLCGAGRQREEDVRRWKRELEDALEKECTFFPHTNADEVKKKILEKDEWGLPLYKRAGLVLRNRDQLMEELEKRLDTGLTFTPHIRENSKRIAEKKRRKDAMMRELGRVERKDGGRCNAVLEPRKEEYVSAHSKAILSKARNLPTNFYQRQKHFVEIQNEKLKGTMQNRKQSDREKAQFTAQTPLEVLISSERLVNQMLEKPQERWNRMSSGDADLTKTRKEKIKRQADLQCDFQPKLNPTSLKMASHARDKQVHSRTRLGIEEYNEEKYKECTFAPDTSKPPIMGYYERYDRPKGKAQISVSEALKSGRFDTFMEQIEEHRRMRSEKAEKAKQAREEQQLQECTFRPNLESTRDCDNRKMKNAEFDRLPGMDAYMERRLLAQRQKEEKEEREAHVFHRFTNQWRNCPTVVQPFKLSCYSDS